MMTLSTLPLFLSTLLSVFLLVTPHQPPSFPGTQDNLQGYHQQQAAQAHQQQQQQQYQQQQQQQQQYQQQQEHQTPPPPQGQQPQQAQKFGGEQAKDEGHIKEHLEGKVDPIANMSPEQLQFHYFNMHDLNRDGRLDGIELIKAITHFHQENPGPQHKGSSLPPPLPSEIELEQMIDSILREDDFNADGFIDYGEFLKAQKHREEQARQQHQQQQQQQNQQQQQQQQPPQH